VQAIIEQLDPPRWPRIGAADLEQPLRTDGRELYGPDGFCGVQFGVAELHHRHPSTKVMIDEIRAASDRVTIIAGGPLSNIAAMFQREPDLATQVGHLVIVGGTLRGPGNVTAAAEFNIYCDADAARQVFHSPVTKTLVPLDISSQVVLGYDLLSHLSANLSSADQLLQAILPGMFHTYRQRLGREGILVHEVVGLMAVTAPELFTTEPLHGDVETGDCLTHGVTVIDHRHRPGGMPNMDVAVDLDAPAVVEAIGCRLKNL
jgi:purine nucleosidase